MMDHVCKWACLCYSWSSIMGLMALKYGWVIGLFLFSVFVLVYGWGCGGWWQWRVGPRVIAITRVVWAMATHVLHMQVQEYAFVLAPLWTRKRSPASGKGQVACSWNPISCPTNKHWGLWIIKNGLQSTAIGPMAINFLWGYFVDIGYASWGIVSSWCQMLLFLVSHPSYGIVGSWWWFEIHHPGIRGRDEIFYFYFFLTNVSY